MNKLAAIFALLCATALPSPSQFKVTGFVARGKLAGIVTDSTNVPIPDATVLVHWDKPGEGHVPSQIPPSQMGLGDIRLKTNMLGQFSASLTPGFYDVTALVDGYEPGKQKLVEVRDDKTIFQWFWLTFSSHSK
jgi:hypothetical protein